MDRKELVQRFEADKEKFARLSDTGLKGIGHLIEYLKMKDDRDFENLAPDVHNLLTGLAHIAEDEERCLKLLNANNKAEAVEAMHKILFRLDAQINKDIDAIEKHQTINLTELIQLTQDYRKAVKELGKVNV